MFFNQTTRDCGTVTVQESPPDRSELSISLDSLDSPGPNVVDVSYTITNNITSGNGERLTGDYRVTVDGTEVASGSETVNAGSSVSGTAPLQSIESGQRNVCIELV
jgi:hypothetical protein